MSTLPSFSRAAVWYERGINMAGVSVKVLVLGS
jgi:hypothetical protein